MDYKEFASKLKSKYPAYNDMNDVELATKFIYNYPDYSDVTFDNKSQNEREKYLKPLMKADQEKRYQASVEKKEASKNLKPYVEDASTDQSRIDKLGDKLLHKGTSIVPAIFPTAASVPYDTASTLSRRVSNVKNIGKGLLDVLGLPARGIAALATEQEITDPSAYALKPLVEKLKKQISRIPDLEPSYNPITGKKLPELRDLSKIPVELLGQILSDPTTFLPGGFGKLIGRGILKKSLSIPKKIAKETGEKSVAAGRRKIVKDIVKQNLEGRPWPFGNWGDFYEKLGIRTQKKLDKLGFIKESELLRPDLDAIESVVKKGVPVDEAVLKSHSVKISDALQELRDKVRSGTHPDVAPEDIQRVLRELDKVHDTYTDAAKTGIKLLEIPGQNIVKKQASPLQAEMLRRKMEQGLYAKGSIFAHPAKTKAKELSGRALQGAILEELPGVASKNKSIVDLLNIKELAEEGLEASVSFRDPTSIPAGVLQKYLFQPIVAPALIKSAKPLGQLGYISTHGIRKYIADKDKIRREAALKKLLAKGK